VVISNEDVYNKLLCQKACTVIVNTHCFSAANDIVGQLCFIMSASYVLLYRLNKTYLLSPEVCSTVPGI